MLAAQSLMPFLRHIYHGSTIGRLTLTAILFGCQRFVWRLHVAELTLQTVQKSCNCRVVVNAQNILQGPTKSVVVVEVMT